MVCGDCDGFCALLGWWSVCIHVPQGNNYLQVHFSVILAWNNVLRVLNFAICTIACIG